MQARFETGTIATHEEVCRSGIMTSRQCCLLAILGRTTLAQAELAVTGAICGAGTEVEMMTKKESMLLSIVIYSAAITQHGPAGGRPPWQAALSLAASLPADPLLTGKQAHLARALGSGDYSEIQSFYSPFTLLPGHVTLKTWLGICRIPLRQRGISVMGDGSVSNRRQNTPAPCQGLPHVTPPHSPSSLVAGMCHLTERTEIQVVHMFIVTQLVSGRTAI